MSSMGFVELLSHVCSYRARISNSLRNFASLLYVYEACIYMPIRSISCSLDARNSPMICTPYPL